MGPDSSKNRYQFTGSNSGIASRRRTTHHGTDPDGYFRSESEERIAGGGNGGWGAKSMGEGDVELAHANGGFDTNVVGGRRDNQAIWGVPVHDSGLDDKARIHNPLQITQFRPTDCGDTRGQKKASLGPQSRYDG